MVTCDRRIIDARNDVIDSSYRKSHPNSLEVSWRTGDDITIRAATSCYAIGMATMYRTDIAKQALPIPNRSAHDLWMTLYASERGVCVNLEEQLVSYRRHGSNASGTLSGIHSKRDWYNIRVAARQQTADEFCRRFPSSRHAATIRDFADARTRKDIVRLFKYRAISPTVVFFEIALAFCPAALFDAALNSIRRRAR